MLLDRAGLPTADLTDKHMTNFLYAGEAQAPIGVVGFEVYARDALLRSVVDDLLDIAKQTGVPFKAP